MGALVRVSGRSLKGHWLPWLPPSAVLIASVLAALWWEMHERLRIGALGTDALSDLLFGYFGEGMAHNR